MLKPLSLSVSLAVALGAASMSLAAGHHKTYASEQVAPSSQSVIPSAQSIGEGCGVAETCGPVAKKCAFFDKFKMPKHEYTYEWVLKKKKVHKPLFGHKGGDCGAPACDSCGTYPTAQSYGSPQVMGSGQYLGSGQAMGTTQIPASYSMPQTGSMMPASGTDAPPAPAVEPPTAPAPPAPPAPPTASTGGLQLLPAGY